MKLIYNGPREKVMVAGHGPHARGETKDYPAARARELLAKERQQFSAVKPQGKTGGRPKGGGKAAKAP